MNRLLNILIFLILANCSIASDFQSKSDSLLKLLEEMPEDSNRVIVLNKLSSEYMFYFHDQKLSFIREALLLSRKLDYTSGELISLERMAMFHYNKSQPDSAMHYLKLAKELTLASNNETYLPNLYAVYSLVYLSLADYYNAIDNAYNSFELARELEHEESIARAYVRLGIIYLRINKYRKSIKFIEDALEYHTKLDNSVEIDVDHYFLAEAYTKLNEKEKAIFHFEKILDKREAYKNSDVSGNMFHIEGHVDALNGNYNSAIDNHVQAIILMQQAGTQKRITEVYLNIIELFVELLKNDQPVIDAERSIATLGYINFEDFASSSCKTMKERRENNMLISTLQTLIEYNILKQNMKEAFTLGQEYILLKDSLQKLENAINIAEQQVKFENEQHEKQIELLNLQNKANEEKIISRQQQQYTYLGSVALLLIVIIALRSRIKTIRLGKDLIQEKNDLLESAKDKSNQSEKFKEQFLANVSHEIRTPMNAIVGMTNLLLKSKHLDGQKKYLDAMNHSAKNLLVLLNDILDLSKLEAGKMKVLKMPFNPWEVIENINKSVKSKADEKGIELVITLDKNIPRSLIGDSKKLYQILSNLVLNGIAFTEEGTVEIKCYLSKVEDYTGTLNFIVKDTGIGIVYEKQEKILETFVKVYDKAKLNYGGSGLELAIIKQMVELQGGNIRLESKPSEGTAFFLEIPYLLSVEDILENEVSLSETTVDLTGLSVLLVEDNEFNIIVAKDELESSIDDVNIELAGNGSIAVDMIIKQKYDIVLMDVQMPVMNGYEATKAIRKLKNSKSSIPIIAMTANNMQQEIDSCKKAGMDEYISKPFHTAELLGKMRTLISENAGA